MDNIKKHMSMQIDKARMQVRNQQEQLKFVNTHQPSRVDGHKAFLEELEDELDFYLDCMEEIVRCESQCGCK